jgi:hypothetical protein
VSRWVFLRFFHCRVPQAFLFVIHSTLSLCSTTAMASQHPVTPALRPALFQRCPCFSGGCSGGRGDSGFRKEGSPTKVIDRCDTHPKPSTLHGGRLLSRGAGWEKRSSHGEVCALNPTPPPPTRPTCSRIPCSLGWRVLPRWVTVGSRLVSRDFFNLAPRTLDSLL